MSFGATSRVASRVAWGVSAISAVMLILAVVFRYLARWEELSPDIGSWQVTVGYAVASLVIPVLGALISSRRPENPIGPILCAIGLATAAENAAEGYAVFALSEGAIGGVWSAWVTAWIWTFSVGFLPFVFLLFPNGKLPSRRWRPVAWFAAILCVLLPVGYALLPGSLASFPDIENPLGWGGGEDRILPGVDQALAWTLLVLTGLLSVVSLMVRFRGSSGEERQQIKWVAYTAVLLILYVLVDLFFQEAIAPVVPILDAVLIGAFYVAIAVAILRYRLYDIDRIINRTLVYAILTATLILVYLGSVVLLQALFRSLTGEVTQLVIVASTLAIAALFNPLRRRIQGLVDRRFYRKKYDAARVLEAFSLKLRDETDLMALSREVVGVVGETVAPEHVSLWMAPVADGRDGGR